MRQWTEQPLNLKHGTHKGRKKKSSVMRMMTQKKKIILVSGSRARI